MMTMRRYGPEHDAVEALLARARTLSPAEVDALRSGSRDAAWIADVRQLQAALGLRTGDEVEGVDVSAAVAAIRASALGTMDGRGALFAAWQAGWLTERSVFVSWPFSPLAWTAVAVGARSALPHDLYVGVVSVWRSAVGHAHPDDGSRGAPLVGCDCERDAGQCQVCSRPDLIDLWCDDCRSYAAQDAEVTR